MSTHNDMMADALIVKVAEQAQAIEEMKRERAILREQNTQLRTDTLFSLQTLRAERDALEALLRETRQEVEMWTPDEAYAQPQDVVLLNKWYALRDRIDAALAKDRS